MKHFSRIKTLVPKVAFPTLLLAVVGILAFTNYVPDSWLTGWDNLQQELNFNINWERHLDSAWQEYQGLGLPATMAHASDLVRLAFVKVLNFVVASHDLRYVYLFLCLAIGALGLYSLLNWLIFQLRERKHLDISTTQARAVAFIGALFFILNLGTLQNFYAPIEMFPTAWAFLPWLFLYVFKCLEKPVAKHFLIFGLISLLATPMAYTPTIFAVYALAVGLIFIFKILSAIPHPTTLFPTFKKILGLCLIVFAINSFWLLPFLYSFVNQASTTVIDAKINQMASEDSYALNQKYGSVQNLALLKGFWFDNVDYKLQDREFNYMFDEWRSYQEIPAIPAIGYLLFGIVLLGVIYSFVVGAPYRFSLAFLLIIGGVIFLNSNPPLGQVFDDLRNSIPIFKEALRFPFTKIAPLLTMLYALFFGLGMLGIVQAIKKVSGLRLTLPLSLILTALMVIFCFPMFAGHLVYKELQVKIPDAYFQMFNWFETQPANLRIADLPQPNYWGWNFYDWGYRGSGFIWYGLKQPVMDRSFDVWSSKNEQYYNEVSNAIYNLDFDQLAQIAQKYRIGWLVYDSSINVNLNEEHQKFYQEQFLPLLAKDSRFKLEQTFGDQLVIFSYLANVQNPELITVAKPVQNVSGDPMPSAKDNAYAEGEYVSSDEPNTSYLIRNTNISNQITSTDRNLIYTADLQSGGDLTLPAYWETENYAAVEVAAKSEGGRKLVVKLTYLVPEISQGNTKLFPNEPITQVIDLPLADYYLGNSYGFVKVNNITAQFQSYGNLIVDKTQTVNAYSLTEAQRIDLTPSFASVPAGHCSDTKSKLGSFVGKDTNGEVINMSARKAIGCLYVGVEPVFNNNYLLNLEFKYQSLTKLLPSICVLQVNINKCINQVVDPNLPNSPATFTSYNQFVEMTSKLNSAAGFQLMVDALNSDISHQINYRDIFVSYFPLVKQIKLDAAALDKATKLSINIGNSPITVSYPKLTQTGLNYSANLALAAQRLTLNCGVKSTGIFNSNFDVTNNSLEFQATDADSCQVFTNLTLPHDASYLLTSSTTHLIGQQAKLCISNPQLQKCVQEYNLGNSPGQNTLYTIIPSQTVGSGYDIRISNLSRGDFPTINSVQALELQFYPTNFLTKIKLTNASVKFDTISSLQLESVQRHAAFWYTAVVNGQGYLNLNQASAAGWKLLNVNAESVQINGWAQGWQINVATPTKITIIYWPQLLEYLGMLMCVAMLLVLVVNVVWERRAIRQELYQET